MNAQTIVDSYNPEHDMIANGPNVTWAEKILADDVLYLLDQVNKLKAELKSIAKTQAVKA